MSRERAVGIDFGTTNSVVARGGEGASGIVPTRDGHRVVPSVVSITPDGAVVGREALERAHRGDDQTVRAIKRGLGNDDAGLTGPDGTNYRPEQVVALVVRSLKVQAERHLDARVTDAVLSVPAYFGHSRREVIHTAGRIAGLTVESLISEPTAACLGYDAGSGRSETTETVVVYDLGGGTFDVSLVEISEGVYDVESTSGHIHLGGRDWDARIVDWLLGTVADDPGVVADDRVAMARLDAAAKRAKHDLSQDDATTIVVPDLPGERSLETELTRAKFEELTADLVEGTIDICRDLIEEADLNAWTIDEVVLVGGGTRMPMIREAVYDFFGQAPSTEPNPEEAVAVGAGIRAAATGPGGVPDSESRADPAGAPILRDVVPKALGIETVVDGERGRFSPVIERNTSVPAGLTKRYWTVRDDQRRIRVRVFQGDSERVADNEFLGEFEVGDIPPAPAGEVSVTVRFVVDVNGVLSVSAADRASGASDGLTLDSPFERDDQEVRRLRDTLPTLAPDDGLPDRQTSPDTEILGEPG